MSQHTILSQAWSNTGSPRHAFHTTEKAAVIVTTLPHTAHTHNPLVIIIVRGIQKECLERRGTRESEKRDERHGKITKQLIITK